MRKLHAIVVFSMVILIQITPGPLGFRPAYAFVGPLTKFSSVGTQLLVTKGSKVCAPAVAAATNIAVNPTTGNIVAKAVQGISMGSGSGLAMWGASIALNLAFDAFSDYVKNHPSDFPLLSTPLNSATSYNPPIVGNIVTPVGLSSNLRITLYRNLIVANAIRPFSLGYGTGAHYLLSEYGAHYSIDYLGVDSSPTNGVYNIYQYFGTITQDPITPRPGIISPAAFASAFAHSPETEAEIYKLIWGTPAATWNPLMEAQVFPFSSAQVKAATAGARADALRRAADVAETVAAADPTNTAKEIAAIEARTSAEQAEIDAQGEEAIVESAPEEIITPDEPDIPYTPSALNGPYTLPEVDFGQRLIDFVTAVKGTSIFSLPNSVFGNIPGAGNSQMTINGGQIFGTHIFDFADLSSMWLVLRGIVLTGFSFIAVRVVCLKK